MSAATGAEDVSATGSRRGCCRRRRPSGSRPARIRRASGIAARSPSAPAGDRRSRRICASRSSRSRIGQSRTRLARGMQFCAPAFIARIAVSSPRVLRNDQERHVDVALLQDRERVERAERRRRRCPRARRPRLDAASAASRPSREVTRSSDRLEAAATQLLEEERGVGRGVVHHESPDRNTH